MDNFNEIIDAVLLSSNPVSNELQMKNDQLNIQIFELKVSISNLNETVDKLVHEANKLNKKAS